MIRDRIVHDCFPFAGHPPELELLEIRLHELEGVVDHVVIAEARLTHSGKPKPLNFEANRDRFRKFLDRITYVVVEDFPPADMSKLGESWKYERHQRDALARGLAGAKDGDLVITGDLDEIPRASALAGYDPSTGLAGLDLSLHTYWFNMACRSIEYPWCKVLPYSLARHMTHCQIRYTFGHPILKNGGWHFSYMGGPKEIVQKIESFAHQEYNVDRCKDPEAILGRMKAGIDPHERNIRYAIEPLDDSYPRYIRENRERFRTLIGELQTPALPAAPPSSPPLLPPSVAPLEELRTVEWNRRVWGAYTWPKDGDEWTEMAEFSGVPYDRWKDTLARTFLFPYLRKDKVVMEIGAGHGRWSEMIVPRSKYTWLADISRKCLEYCEKRLVGAPNVGFIVPNLSGKRCFDDMEWWPASPWERLRDKVSIDGPLDFIWSFDTFVHIEEPDATAYVREFARTLRKDGMGVIHHPGSPAPEQRLRGCRSRMTWRDWARILRKERLHVIRQVDIWDGGDVRLNADMITVFVKVT